MELIFCYQFLTPLNLTLGRMYLVPTLCLNQIWNALKLFLFHFCKKGRSVSLWLVPRGRRRLGSFPGLLYKEHKSRNMRVSSNHRKRIVQCFLKELHFQVYGSTRSPTGKVFLTFTLNQMHVYGWYNAVIYHIYDINVISSAWFPLKITEKMNM